MILSRTDSNDLSVVSLEDEEEVCFSRSVDISAHSLDCETRKRTNSCVTGRFTKLQMIHHPSAL